MANDIENTDIGFEQEYAPVAPVEAIEVDGKILTKEDAEITPFGVIKAMAEKLGQTINDPKTGCKKCMGRGYIGRDSATKSPIPCTCIYPDFNNQNNRRAFEQTRKLTRAERRKQKRDNDKYAKKLRKWSNR